MFRTVPQSIIRSFSTVHIAVLSWSCSQAVWHTSLLYVQWKTPGDDQSNCPKHVEFYSKNKFEKLVHLVGFYYKNLSLWTITWTPKKMYFISIIFYVCDPEEGLIWKFETPINCSLDTVRSSGDSTNVVSVTTMWPEEIGIIFCLKYCQGGHTDLRWS